MDPVLPTVVLGAGITGLATAYRLHRDAPERGVVVLEAADRVGGVVGSSEVDGYRIDHAANGFLTNAPETLELAGELGLEVVPAAPAARRRYLYREGGLRPVPASPPALLTSELLSPLGKLRALAEPLAPRRNESRGENGDDESVHAFLARRLGRRAADAFAEAFVLGVTAGDPRELSADALFPRLTALEREHGSLLRGALAARRAANAAPPEPGAGGAPPRGRLATIAGGGLARLTEALASALGERVRTGARVTALERRAADRPGGGWRVRLDSGDAVDAAALVLALPAPVAAELLRPHAPAASGALAAIPYAPVRVLGLGYRRVDVPHALDGFGFLAPAGEGIRSLGVLWSSVLFEDRAPEDRVLLRVIAGGTRDPAMVELTDDAALAAVRDDLRVAMGIVAEPEVARQIRWPRGIPQYTLGHRARVEAAEAALESLTDLGDVVLAGNAYRGVGINDCVRDAGRAARRVAEAVAASSARPRAPSVREGAS